jgi:hypothetical protein
MKDVFNDDMTNDNPAGMTNLNNFGATWLTVPVSWPTLHFLGSGCLLAETMSSCGLQAFHIKPSTFFTDTLPELVQY